MAFLTGSQLTLMYDERGVRQLIGDLNVASTDSLDTNPVLLELISQAEAEILAAALTGERYSVDDLNGLITADPPVVGAAMLRRLTADLTYAYLVSRRAKGATSVESQVPRFRQAQMMIEQLRLGQRVFPNIPEVQEAGLPSIGNVHPQTNPNRPIYSADIAHRIFPWNPSRNLPGGYGGWGC
jgi:hypothetical protein